MVITTGTAWADDNGRQREEPEDIGDGAIAYLIKKRRENSLVYVIGQRRLYWVCNDDYDSFDPVYTGDDYVKKICLSCGRLKPTEEFAPNQVKTGGIRVRRPRCISCFNRDSGKKMTTKVRKAYLAKHGPKKGDAWQCAVCEKVSVAWVNVKIVVDHDQETGCPRGLICDSCNTGLGRFKNGENHLMNAIEYLNGPEES